MNVYSYNLAGKAFRVSVFESTGNSWQMSGKWDASSSTLTWTRDLDDGIRMTASYQLVNADEFKFSYRAKKEDGKVYFRLEGTAKRVEDKK